MIGIGEGIAIMSICAPVTVAIIKLVPSRNGNGKTSFCSEHHHLSKSMEEVKEDVAEVFKKVNQVAQDVAHIRGFIEKEAINEYQR